MHLISMIIHFVRLFFLSLRTLLFYRVCLRPQATGIRGRVFYYFLFVSIKRMKNIRVFIISGAERRFPGFPGLTADG